MVSGMPKNKNISYAAKLNFNEANRDNVCFQFSFSILFPMSTLEVGLRLVNEAKFKNNSIVALQLLCSGIGTMFSTSFTLPLGQLGVFPDRSGVCQR